MPRFVVIPRDPTGAFRDWSPADMQRLIERYQAWTEGLRREGRLHLGEKLVDGRGRVLRGGEGGVSVTDGPFAEAKEVVGGLWIVEADDLDHAVRLTSDCPHVEFGTLEVREIDELGGDAD